MKRGLITWDKAELPAAAFDTRLARVRHVLAEHDLSALVVYADVWRSNQGRYFSNFMPYWNRALLVIAPEGAPALLCALSPRVYPWIRSVTNIEEIRPSPNLAQQLLAMGSEKGWKKLGVLDLDALPQDLHAPLTKAFDSVVDVPWSAVHTGPDPAELSLYRRAVALARESLEQEIPDGPGSLDHEFTGRLERRLRLAGAEDLVVLLSNGDTPPLPAVGAFLADEFSVTLAFEYRGHWVKLSRASASPDTLASLRNRFDDVLAAGLFADPASPVYLESLSGAYPWEPCGADDLAPGMLFTACAEIQSGHRRLFYGDTCIRRERGAELL